MRIDSSGNLLVGTTDYNDNVAGIGLSADNYFYVVRQQDTANAGRVATFNRKGADGSILDFAKDGTTVGSWQSRAGLVSTIILDPRSGGMGLTGSGSRFTPTNESGVESDNRNDIGTSDYRFKNLYLSGGVYLGGTNAGHLLDDYEEVNFTATLRGSSAEPSTLVTVTGFATKVGRIVQYSIGFENISTTGYAGDLTITGLPFTNNGGRAIGNIVGYTGLTFAGSQSFSVISVGSTNLEALSISSSGVWAHSTHNPGNTRYFWLTGTYMTTQ